MDPTKISYCVCCGFLLSVMRENLGPDIYIYIYIYTERERERERERENDLVS